MFGLFEQNLVFRFEVVNNRREIMGLFAKMSETVRALIGEYSQTQNEMIYYSNQCGCRGSRCVLN